MAKIILQRRKFFLRSLQWYIRKNNDNKVSNNKKEKTKYTKLLKRFVSNSNELVYSYILLKISLFRAYVKENKQNQRNIALPQGYSLRYLPDLLWMGQILISFRYFLYRRYHCPHCQFSIFVQMVASTLFLGGYQIIRYCGWASTA